LRSNINCDLSQLCTVLALKEGTLMKVYKAWHAREVVVKAFKSKIVVLTGGFAPLDPYQGYGLHPPEVLATPLDHQQNFEYPALPTPNQKSRIPPLRTGCCFENLSREAYLFTCVYPVFFVPKCFFVPKFVLAYFVPWSFVFCYRFLNYVSWWIWANNTSICPA